MPTKFSNAYDFGNGSVRVGIFMVYFKKSDDEANGFESVGCR